MPPEPVPADPGRDEDLTWLDRDPERQTWLARAREHDEPPQEEEYADCAPLTDDELAGIEAAAADELLKARIIALATALLDPDEARAAEQEVLDRAARLTGTAAPGWNPRGTGNAPGPGRSGSPSSSQPGRAARRVRHLAAAHPPGPGPDLLVTLEPLTTDPCGHRHQANGHDPGVKLRHLSQVQAP